MGEELTIEEAREELLIAKLRNSDAQSRYRRALAELDNAWWLWEGTKTAVHDARVELTAAEDRRRDRNKRKAARSV